MDALESHGFACYAVGGCVRDMLLGLTPQDYDLCTNALPEQIRTVFAEKRLILNGEKHGTVGVITDGGVVEITTFRSEGDYTDSRHPGWVKYLDSIEADLARRDFTVNAMAYSPKRALVDPFGGQQDLQNGILRAVGNPTARFTEDALRIVRGMRFAVRYQLTLQDDTMEAMYACASLLEHIAKERIFDELCKLLLRTTGEDLLRFSAILAQIIPGLAPTIGFAQHSSHHLYDVFTHTAYVTGGVEEELSLRWAALLHDLGKVHTFTTDENGNGHFYGHAAVSAQLADEILHRLKAPTALREDVVFLIAQHMTPVLPERKRMRRQLSKWGAERLQKLLMLQKADFSGKGTVNEDFPFDETNALLQALLEENSCLSLKDLAVNGHDLMALGFSGEAVGQCLNWLLQQVVEETLENEKAVLLTAVKNKK